jgi:hypothetical protein
MPFRHLSSGQIDSITYHPSYPKAYAPVGDTILSGPLGGKVARSAGQGAREMGEGQGVQRRREWQKKICFAFPGARSLVSPPLCHCAFAPYSPNSGRGASGGKGLCFLS